MIASRAGNSKKSPGRELKILRKDWHRPAPGLAGPTSNHHKLRKRLHKPCANAGKRLALLMRIFKKVRVASLRIPEKVRIGC